MLLRGFSSGAVALSGVEAVSNGVPSFQKPESKNAATTLVWMGSILGVCFLGRFGAGVAPQAVPRSGRRQRTRSDGRAHLRRQGRDVLAHDGRHVRDPDPRGQHGVRRLPRPGIDHRQGRLPAPPVLQPRRPVGVLQRSDLPGGHRQHPDRRLQRRHLQADPALRVRCLHRLHAQPGGHGQTPPQTQGGPVAGQHGHQRHRRVRDRTASPWSWWSPSSPKAHGSRRR